MLVAAANPCPCGRGEDDPRCGCAPHDISRYGARLSGALADRIDIVASLAQPDGDAMHGEPGEASADVRARVIAARARQAERLGPGRSNADMTAAEARAQPLTADARDLLRTAYEVRRLSGRAHDRTLRLARTEADLAGAEEIGLAEMGAALALRRRDDE
jgi:magnesium chelatase family protein